MIGQALLHYRIRDRIGAGGMGEVYRATDTTLGRDVAIKLLPAEVAYDPARLARFRREAQLLSALNHPHVATIYGLEQVEGVPFLALELVEGEDLAQRLARGPIPVDEALEIAVQVAGAVEAAHERGIVHRDLKPANIKITPEGRVKVLDFGLAKAWGGDAADGASAESPTLTRAGTMAGVILGTAAYMAPEQARGKAVDRRADVWSFGVLLWEMLTGRRLFTGETVADVLAAVVTKEPDLDALPPATPPAVRRLIARCLRRDPRARLPDVGAARLELQEVRAAAGSGSDPSLGGPPRVAAASSRRERLAWAAVAVAATAAAAIAFVHLTEPRPAPPLPLRFTIDPPDGRTFARDRHPLASPDGRKVLFFASNGPSTAPPAIWVRSLDSLDLQPLPETEGAEAPFWSPDSRHVAFFVDGQLRALSVPDGTVRKICDLPAEGVGAADWNAKGLILFSTGGEKGRVYSVDDGGGEARVVLAPDESRGEALEHAPQFLPDGSHFVVWVGSPREDVRGTYLVSLDAPARKRRLTAANARYAAGHLLFMREGSLLAQAFDRGTGEVSGGPAVVANGVGSTSLPDGGTVGWFAASSQGTLAYFSGYSPAGGVSQLAWVDRAGRRVGTVGDPGSYGQLTLSPDGRQVAAEIRGDRNLRDLWVIDVARGVASRATATPDADEADPVWSPDGLTLTFASLDGKRGMLRRKGLRPSDSEAMLGESLRFAYPECWSRDGRTLLFERGPSGENGVWALHLPGGSLTPVLDGRFHVDEPKLSPDGRWLAYVSRESGRDEVYVEPYGLPGERVRISVAGGGQPAWRSDGRELFYVSLENQLMAVDVRPAGQRATVGVPSTLFALLSVLGTNQDDYAASADGQRFLVKLPLGADSQRLRLTVITHWPSLLKQP